MITSWTDDENNDQHDDDDDDDDINDADDDDHGSDDDLVKLASISLTNNIFTHIVLTFDAHCAPVK